VHILRRVLALAIILAGLQSLVIVSAVDARATEIPCSADRTQPRCFGEDFLLNGQVDMVTENSSFRTAVSAQGVVSGLKKITTSGVRRNLSGSVHMTRARLAKECLTRQSRALIPVYVWYMCGSGPARGIEAIAQARFIAAHNADLRYGHVSPDVQWEVRTSAGTADIVLYPEVPSYPATTGAPQVIEVKQEGGISEAATQQQAEKYRVAITSDRPPAALRNFSVHPYRECGSRTKQLA
jgi:hypothetical protein